MNAYPELAMHGLCWLPVFISSECVDFSELSEGGHITCTSAIRPWLCCGYLWCCRDTYSDNGVIYSNIKSSKFVSFDDVWCYVKSLS